MPRVKIDTPGVTVEIDANEASADALGDLALKLFREAGGWPQPEPTSAGFAADIGRRWTPDHANIGGNGYAGPGEVTA